MKALKAMVGLFVFAGFAVQARTIDIDYGNTSIAENRSLAEANVCKMTVSAVEHAQSQDGFRMGEPARFRREVVPTGTIAGEDKTIEDVTDNKSINISVVEYRTQNNK